MSRGNDTQHRTLYHVLKRQFCCCPKVPVGSERAKLADGAGRFVEPIDRGMAGWGARFRPTSPLPLANAKDHNHYHCSKKRIHDYHNRTSRQPAQAHLAQRLVNVPVFEGPSLKNQVVPLCGAGCRFPGTLVSPTETCQRISLTFRSIFLAAPWHVPIGLRPVVDSSKVLRDGLAGAGP